MKIIDLKQGSPEWLAFRKGKIGGSDAPVIMGVSPWMTPYELWEYKIGTREIEVKPCMWRGLNLEDEARKLFFDLYDMDMCPCVVQSSDNQWAIASLDGMNFLGTQILEIKCPGIHDHMQAVVGIVPEKYIPQIQHQIYVCQTSCCHYFSYRPECSEGVYAHIIVQRDDDYIRRMLSFEIDFMECLENFVSPNLCDRDYVSRDDPEWVDCVYNYMKYKEFAYESTKEMDFYRNKLIALSGKNSSKGGGIKLCQVTRRGNVDYSAIQEIKNLDVERYRKPPVQSWRITEDKV